LLPHLREAIRSFWVDALLKNLVVPGVSLAESSPNDMYWAIIQLGQDLDDWAAGLDRDVPPGDDRSLRIGGGAP
jgi:hypothetical protein